MVGYFEGGEVPENIDFFFWPQLLQYLGYFGLLAVVMVIFRHERKD